MRRAALPLLALALLLGAGGARADGVEGVWGFVGTDGAARCGGTAVLVFHDGIYARVLPKLGTLSGVKAHVMGSSTYAFSGDRLEVAPVLTWTAPEPARSYLLRRGAAPELVREGDPPARLKPCPELDASRLIP
ncbi:hypothetical protein NUH88_20250 [Nisaea acidiphila]|uniref:DUF2147 domain-containing protein n=1 Tax=Nisaea acidiphila TaxID=1862145 RepID=A0A9J7AWA4_9PROT|nr:hypothetical protein [Nisaea acidiphila]UUX49717.1 hypothetical protein NUH88_20250 [Nisaea acidiphila]